MIFKYPEHYENLTVCCTRQIFRKYKGGSPPPDGNFPLPAGDYLPWGGIFGPDESGNHFLFTGSGYLFQTVDAETVTAFANFVFLVVVSFPCRFDLLFANLYVYMSTSMPLLFRRWTRVFSEVAFWNSAEYGILYGIGFISRNSAKFFTVQFHGIPCRFVYTEFRTKNMYV